MGNGEGDGTGPGKEKPSIQSQSIIEQDQFTGRSIITGAII